MCLQHIELVRDEQEDGASTAQAGSGSLN
jgi:hypothetical protein